MALEEKIMTDLKVAMLAKDEAALRSLRAIKAAIIIAKTSEGAGGVLKEEDEIKMYQSYNSVKSIAEKLEKNDCNEKDYENIIFHIDQINYNKTIIKL